MANYNLEPTLHFLDELSHNNNKAWFDSHRADYETARGQYEQLLNDLIDEFRASDNLQGLKARDCMSRIYRDIRFTRDKSPYKTNLGAVIAPGGWRSVYPGYYISIEPHGQSMVAGGWYNPSAEQLDRFRQAIDEDATEFRRITEDSSFVEAFGAVEGDRLRTAPRGYDRAHPDIDLLQLRQITAVHRFSDQEILADGLKEHIVLLCRAMRPFLNYLYSLK